MILARSEIIAIVGAENRGLLHVAYCLIVPTESFQAASEMAVRRQRAKTSYFPRSDCAASFAHCS